MPYECQQIGASRRRIVVPRALIPQPVSGAPTDSDDFNLRAGTGIVSVTVHIHGEDGTATAASNLPLILTVRRGADVRTRTLNLPDDGTLTIESPAPNTIISINVAVDPAPINGQPNTIGNNGFYSLEVTFFAEQQACPAVNAAATPCVDPAPAPEFVATCDAGATYCAPFNDGFCRSPFRAATFECRAAAGVCDVAENCLGNRPDCPADSVRPTSFVCAPSAAPCELEATCDGAGKTCPAKLPRPAEPKFVCAKPNPITQPCADDAVCNGVAITCPAFPPKAKVLPPGNYFRSRIVCDRADDPCERDAVCSPTSTVCPPKRNRDDGLWCHPDSHETFEEAKPDFLPSKDKAKVKKCFGRCDDGVCRHFATQADNKICTDLDRIG